MDVIRMSPLLDSFIEAGLVNGVIAPVQASNEANLLFILNIESLLKNLQTFYLY